MPSQLFARNASNLCNSSDAGGELDLREQAKHHVRYAVEEASTALPVVAAGRVTYGWLRLFRLQHRREQFLRHGKL